MYSCSNVSVVLYIFTMKYTNCEARVMLLTPASSNLIHLISKGIEFITFFRHGHIPPETNKNIIAPPLMPFTSHFQIYLENMGEKLPTPNSGV